MKYCTNCGRPITDETAGCTVCDQSGVQENRNQAQEAPKVDLTKNVTEQEQATNSQPFQTPTQPQGAQSWESYQNAEPQPPQQDTIPTALKAIIIIAIILIGGVGSIAGLIGGVILSKSPSEDYRKFGKTLIIVSSVMIILWFVCCLAGGALGVLSNIMYY